MNTVNAIDTTETPKPAPGTFTLISEEGGVKTYTYTVKSGGTPGGVRTQYAKVYDATGANIRVTDVDGKTYYEATYLSPNTMVYVKVK